MSQKSRRKKQAKSKKVTYKDKDWYEVIAPKSFNYKPIGKILGLESSLINRTIEMLLYDITGDFRDINLKLKFQVKTVNIEAKKCKTIFIGHNYTSDFVRSLIGRGSTKISTINNFTTKDGYIFRLTTICTTIRRARSSQKIVIRKIMREILAEFAKTLNHEKFIVGVIFREFQNQIARVAKTIYPLGNSSIIKSKLISIPEGGEDTVVPDEEFDIVEIEVERTRKSEIRRSERINVKKYAQQKRRVSNSKEKKEEEKEEIEDEGDE